MTIWCTKACLLDFIFCSTYTERCSVITTVCHRPHDELCSVVTTVCHQPYTELCSVVTTVCHRLNVYGAGGTGSGFIILPIVSYNLISIKIIIIIIIIIDKRSFVSDPCRVSNHLHLIFDMWSLTCICRWSTSNHRIGQLRHSILKVALCKWTLKTNQMSTAFWSPLKALLFQQNIALKKILPTV